MPKCRIEVVIKCVSEDKCSAEDLKTLQEIVACPEKRKELFKADVVKTQRFIIKEVLE